MGRARDSAGNIWETDAQGNAVRLVQPAATAAPATGRIFSLPPNPKDVREQARQAAADAREAERLKLSEAANSRAQLDWSATHNPDGSPKVQAPSLLGNPNLHGPEYLATLPENIRARVQQLLDGRSMLTAREKGQPLGQQLMDAANQADPTFDENASKARYNARQQFTGMGKGALTVQAAERLAQHVNDLYAANKALPGPDLGFSPLSNLATGVANKFHQQQVARYNQILPLISGELQKLTKNGSATVDESTKIEHNLRPDQPQDVRDAAIKEIVRLGRAQYDPLRESWASAWNGSTPPPMPMDFSPATTAIFDNIETGGKPLEMKRDKNGSLIALPAGGPNDPDAGAFVPPGEGGTATGGGSGPGGTPGGGISKTAAGGKTSTTYDPRMSSQIDSMMNAGASKPMIDAVLKRQGLAPISAASFNDAKAWMKANPGQKYFGSNISRTQDLNPLQRAAASPVATFGAKTADTMLAGIPGAIAGEQGRGALDAASALNPDAALFGDITGGIAGSAGAEAGLAARAPAALVKYAPRIADTLYGGVLGFNEAPEGSGASGAFTGALAGLGGGLAGEGLARAGGAALRGVADPAVQYLASKGVPLTVGQALGNSGRVGATIRGIEDAATSIPGVGNVIKARQREGLQGFNSAAFGELPGHSGATGSAGVAEGGQLVDNAYSFLDNTNLPLDAPYAGTEAMIRATAPSRFAPDINDQLDMTASRAVNGELPGRDWQSALRANRANRSSIAGEPYADPAVASHNDIEQNLLGLAQRQGPPDTTGNLDAANLLYSRYQTLAKALDNGPAQQADELFTPGRLDAAARQGANQFKGRAQSIMGNRPFYDLTKAGRSVLPTTVPDSGTATRGLVAMGLTGAAGAAGAGAGAGVGALAGDTKGGAETGLGLTLLLAAGGSKPAQRLLTNALIKRPQMAQDIGEIIARHAGIGGWTGSGVLAPLVAGQ